MATKLTKRQAQVLDHIERAQLVPTFREIADAIGIKSTQVVNDYLNRLEKKGRIVKSSAETSRARSIAVRAALTPEERAEFGLPAVNRCPACNRIIVAGPPAENSARCG